MSETDHRVELPGSDGWTLWRWFVLRGAGFDAARLLRLAIPDLERRLQLLEVHEASAAAIRAQALESVIREIAATDDEATRRRLSKARRKLIAGTAAPQDAPELTGALAELQLATQALDSEQRGLRAYVEQEVAKVARALKQQATDDLFREALAWQNKAALRNMVDPLVGKSETATDSQTRRQQQLAASYLQRYCAKNDTIGFFGPVAWGTLTADGPALDVHPGPTLLARRTVYFEHWAVELLARTLSEDQEVLVWACPRRMPMVRVEDGQARLESGQVVSLTATEAWLFAACDGETTAKRLAEQMLKPLGVVSEQAAYELMRQMTSRRLISWGLEIPTEIDHPDAALASLLEKIEDASVHDRAMAALAELTTRRDVVAKAAGDPQRVGEALDDLEDAFVRVTGASATRRGGQTYAGRMLVYEDCLRSGEIALGPELVRWLSGPLAALLTSARWFTHELAKRYRALLVQIFRDMRGPTGEVDLLRFLRAASPHFAHDPKNSPQLIRALRDELARRWSPILDETHRDGIAKLPDLVAAAFSAPGPGWPLARFHSPDIQLAAASVEAVQRGEFLAVLGELHMGCPTVISPFLLRQHATPEVLLAARVHDVPPPCIAAVTGQETYDRSELTSRCGGDLHVELRDTRSWRPRGEVLAVGDLVVGLRGAELEVRTTDGSRRFDIIAFLERYLIGLATREFHILEPKQHTPRLSLGRLVVEREAWRFDPRELGFAVLDSPTERFVAAAQWARRSGLPRHAFYKVPEEPKPCYVDFHSPPFVENLARSLRSASAVTLGEMLPGHDALWLSDAEGRRYTCELRLVAVDPMAWSAPSSR